MRKLTPTEYNALRWLRQHEPYCPGIPETASQREVVFVLDSLCRKRRAYTEGTDDGWSYHLTEQGKAETTDA